MSIPSTSHPVLSLLALSSPTASAPEAFVALTLQEQTPAQAPPGAEAPPKSVWGGMMVPMLAVFAIFYFVMIGPERKARKKRELMLAAVKKGDRVITSGGMYATVAALGDDTVTLQIDDGVRAKFTRASLQTVIAEDEPAKS